MVSVPMCRNLSGPRSVCLWCIPGPIDVVLTRLRVYTPAVSRLSPLQEQSAGRDAITAVGAGPVEWRRLLQRQPAVLAGQHPACWHRRVWGRGYRRGACVCTKVQHPGRGEVHRSRIPGVCAGRLCMPHQSFRWCSVASRRFRCVIFFSWKYIWCLVLCGENLIFYGPAHAVFLCISGTKVQKQLWEIARINYFTTPKYISDAVHSPPPSPFQSLIGFSYWPGI